MKNKIKYISIFIMCILMHMNLNAQEALTADIMSPTFNQHCQNGKIDLHSNGGFPPYDVIWTRTIFFPPFNILTWIVQENVDPGAEFENHAIVKYDGKYYDPSNGSFYPSDPHNGTYQKLEPYNTGGIKHSIPRKINGYPPMPTGTAIVTINPKSVSSILTYKLKYNTTSNNWDLFELSGAGTTGQTFVMSSNSSAVGPWDINYTTVDVNISAGTHSSGFYLFNIWDLPTPSNTLIAY